MLKKVDAPFTDDQLASLRDFQSCGVMHAYTCPKCGLELIPTHIGLFCRDHGVVQSWALRFTTDGSWQEQVRQMQEMIEELKKDDL